MMKRIVLGAFALSMTLNVACDTGGDPGDGGVDPGVDAGEPAVDAGSPEVDGGEPEVDGGEPEVDGGEPEVDAGPGETIFDRLGGVAGIETAMGGFIGRVAGDPAINSYFLNNDLNATRLTACLVHQVAVATGGPGTAYPSGVGATLDVDDLNGGTVTCRSMEDIHAGLGISAQDNADLTGHLVDELTDLGVATADIDAIGGVLASLTGIVENPNNNETLYHRIGRKPGITAVVGNFVGRVLGDPSINAYFMNNTLDAARLSTCLVRQVAQNGVSGGPAIYDGANDFETDLDKDGNGTLEAGEQCADMVSIHTGMGVSKAEHYTLVDHFIAAAVEENTNNALVNLGAGDGDAVMGVLDSLADAVTNEAVACDVTRAGPDANCNVNTLYQRIGGTVGLNVVVGDAFGRVLGDATTNGYFLNPDFDQAKVDRTAACLVRQFCAASGGFCIYDGANAFDAAIDTDADGTVQTAEQCRDMLTVHAGMNIGAYEQEAFKGHVVAAVVAALPNIAQADADALIGVLDSTDGNVVEVNDFGAPGDAANLYHRIGGKASLIAFLDGVQGGEEGFLSRVVANNTINGFFGAANVPRLRSCLARQLCEATGGPCNYLAAGPLVAFTDTDIGIVDVNATPDDLTDDTISNCLTMVASHPATMTNPPGGTVRIQASDFDSMRVNIIDTLDGLGLPALDRDVIVSALDPVCNDIVETPGQCN